MKSVTRRNLIEICVIPKIISFVQQQKIPAVIDLNVLGEVTI